MMERVYISGPMSGYPDYNYPAFEMCEKRCEAIGIEYVSPRKINQGIDHEFDTWVDYLKRDIRALMDCNAIVFLAGAQNSAGAILEGSIAMSLGYKMYSCESELYSAYQKESQ